MKCEICKKPIETGILNKIKGTVVYVDGKKHYICNECQSKYSIEEIKEKLKA